jgi:hypothetical protein
MTLGSKARLPVAHMVCNGTPPTETKPSLMTHREVETLFHEFGHALQHMLTTQDSTLVSGINGIEWDAVELPSQFMENWCYHEKTGSGSWGRTSDYSQLHFQKAMHARVRVKGCRVAKLARDRTPASYLLFCCCGGGGGGGLWCSLHVVPSILRYSCLAPIAR